MFGKIARRVREGRWVIVGGWWVEPDCNVPSGESFIRQGLYGKRYFKEKFGVETDIGYNPDSFGHNWMLPQILRKMRYTKYMFMRPNPQENKDVPADVFWWESPDGSRVLTYRIFRYGIWGDYEKALTQAFEQEKEHLNPGLDDILVYYGIGNHGGVMSQKLIRTIREMQNDDSGINIVFSDPNRFFERIENSGIEFPVHAYDLQHHAQGCYSTIANIKKMNRQNEHFLGSGEKFAVVANVLADRPYPKQELRKGWELVLFNQFHDIMPGSSILSAYTDVIAWHGEARMIGRQATNNSIQHVASLVNTEGGPNGIPIMVWNPHGHRVSAPALVELAITEGEIPPHRGPLVDEHGTIIPHQLEPGESYTGSDRRRNLVFYPSIPAMGYRTFWLQESHESGAQASHLPLSVEENAAQVRMENKFLSLTINKSTGYISEFINKESGTRIISTDAAVPAVIQDSSDTWSHGVLEFDDDIGAFGGANIRVMEDGPVRAVVRVKSFYGSSKLIQDFILYAEAKEIEVRATLDWHEQLKMLKLQFPVNVRDARSYYAIPFGYIEREPNGHENPGGPYIAVSGISAGGGEAGLIVTNDCKHGFDVEGNVIEMTILRSPAYAHHDPYTLKPEIEYPYMDQGEHIFSYGIRASEGTWLARSAEQSANRLNIPLIALQEYRHGGKYAAEGSFLNVDAENVILTAMKQHEDSEDIIVRIHESDGKRTPVTISIPSIGQSYTGTMQPFEIKTLRFPRNGGECYEIDMIEWDPWK